MVCTCLAYDGELRLERDGFLDQFHERTSALGIGRRQTRQNLPSARSLFGLVSAREFALNDCWPEPPLRQVVGRCYTRMIEERKQVVALLPKPVPDVVFRFRT
jgi:hypothetical protein